MPIRVDAYSNSGMAGGWLLDAGPLRLVLERGEPLELTHVTWQGIEDLVASSLPNAALDPDELVAVVGDDANVLPVHAVWHPVVLEAGPYRIEGEMPTMPGFDPGRALTRPTGEFVLFRDVRLELIGRPELGRVDVAHAFINRYAVERVEADLMLGFFFPGAVVDTTRLPDRPADRVVEPAVPAAPLAGEQLPT